MLKKLTGRNLKIYFRDKLGVFFSLLSVFIVIALYILFLAKQQIDGISNTVNDTLSTKDLSYLINTWILAGLLSITSVTSTLGAFGALVADREKGIIKDFKSAPLNGVFYPIASVVSAFIVGSIISFMSLFIYTILILVTTGYLIPIPYILYCAAFVLLVVFVNASILGFIVSCFSTRSSFTSASLSIGTAIGFLNGVYVPMGSLPIPVSNVLKALPFGQSASVLRQILMKESIDIVFADEPKNILNAYLLKYGIYFEHKDGFMNMWVSIIFLIAVGFIFLVLFFLNYRRKREEI